MTQNKDVNHITMVRHDAVTLFSVGRLCDLYEMHAHQLLRVERLSCSWWMLTTRGQARYAKACADLTELCVAIAYERLRHGL